MRHVTQVQISHVTCMNESCNTGTNKSCHVCEWVMSHMYKQVMSRVCLSHVTCLNGPCHTSMNASRNTYGCVVSHVGMSRVFCVTESYDMDESRHTFMNMSRHTYGCVVSHVYIDWFWLLGRLIHNRAICARIVIMNFELDWDCSVMVSKVPGKKHKKLFNVTNISSITEDRQAKFV